MGGLRVGLTGGIGSGKSFVADELRRLGAVIIDADVLAREVVAPGTPGFHAIIERFGGGVVQRDGTLDRARLGALIFADADARAALNAIVHPLVRARARELDAAAPAESVVVHVIPLLVETGQQNAFDEVIVVDASPAVQLHRIMRRDRLSADAAQARLDAQADRAERLGAATIVIDNSGGSDTTKQRVTEVWASLRRRIQNAKVV